MRPTYRKPYPGWVDNQLFYKGFKIPDIAILNGVEHVGGFVVQCGEASKNEF